MRQTPDAQQPKLTLGEWLCIIRSRAGMSQKELAADLGIPRPLVSAWERDNSLPDIEQFRDVAELCGSAWLWETIKNGGGAHGTGGERGTRASEGANGVGSIRRSHSSLAPNGRLWRCLTRDRGAHNDRRRTLFSPVETRARSRACNRADRCPAPTVDERHSERSICAAEARMEIRFEWLRDGRSLRDCHLSSASGGRSPPRVPCRVLADMACLPPGPAVERPPRIRERVSHKSAGGRYTGKSAGLQMDLRCASAMHGRSALP
jgi:transcriptional regulator with XRE-family HTH domain